MMGGVTNRGSVVNRKISRPHLLPLWLNNTIRRVHIDGEDLPGPLVPRNAGDDRVDGGGGVGPTSAGARDDVDVDRFFLQTKGRFLK